MMVFMSIGLLLTAIATLTLSIRVVQLTEKVVDLEDRCIANHHKIEALTQDLEAERSARADATVDLTKTLAECLSYIYEAID